MNVSAREQALARLEGSRQALRQVLRPQSASSAGAGHAPSAAGSTASFAPWVDGAGLAAVLQLLRQTWQQHPLHDAYRATAEVGNAALRPLAQRHPYALVAGALAVGAVLGWVVPWRRVLGPSALAAGVPALLMGALKPWSAQPWAGLLAALLRVPRQDATTTSTPTDGQTPPAGAAAKAAAATAPN